MEISQNLIEFVQKHENDDVNSLRLKYSYDKKIQTLDFPIDFALLQIEARRKTRKKLPSFVAKSDFIFPTLLSSEQASNEAVAKFHASLVPSGSSLLDLTAGLGIDDMEFALHGCDVISCEIDNVKCEALIHNSEVMGVRDRITVMNTDSIDYVSTTEDVFDVVFADPARRDLSGGRTHALADCQPDILGSLSRIMTISPRFLIKCSPLLDLSLIRDSIDILSHIYVVCFKGECKEVLIDIIKDKGFSGVTVVDLDWTGEISRFHTEFSPADLSYSLPMLNVEKASSFRYLYEPNAGVMKTGAWSVLTNDFPDLVKADQNSHVFLSDSFYPDFPGRIVEILSQPDKKALKALKGARYNVVSRNHPLSAPKIISKYGIIPGGDEFAYAFRYRSTPIFLLGRLKETGQE